MPSEDTQASNPARTRFHLFSYLRAYHTGPIILLVMVVLPLALSLFSWWFMIGVALSLLLTVLHFRTLSQICDKGDSCAAVVVSLDPPLIAIYTDLSKIGTGNPAVKVMEAPVDRMAGAPAKIGDKMTVICTYSNVGANEDRWGDIMPYVAACMTSNEAEIRRMITDIPAEDWQMLKQGLKVVPRPIKPGLFLVAELPAPAAK